MSNLYQKYHITKNDGSPVDPNGQYFVLRIDTDRAAAVAVWMYAMYIIKSDPEFSKELQAWILSLQEGGRTQLAPDDAYASCPFRSFVNYPSLGDVVECEYRIAGKA